MRMCGVSWHTAVRPVRGWPERSSLRLAPPAGANTPPSDTAVVPSANAQRRAAVNLGVLTQKTQADLADGVKREAPVTDLRRQTDLRRVEEIRHAEIIEGTHGHAARRRVGRYDRTVCLMEFAQPRADGRSARAYSYY